MASFRAERAKEQRKNLKAKQSKFDWFRAQKAKQAHEEMLEIDLKHIDEHKRIQEAIVTDSHGRKKTVVLSVKDDVHVHEDIIRREKEFNNVGTSEVGSGDLEAGQSSSGATVAKIEKS
nr:glyceraldehyde-3-phosphate dehydrogenase, testis-specific-like [Ipomoea batatas]